MQNIKRDWAPDNCPDAVVQLIEHDDLLSRLQLRGLESSNGKDVHSATERLKRILIYYHERGRRRGLAIGFAIGVAVAGVVVSGAVLL